MSFLQPFFPSRFAALALAGLFFAGAPLFAKGEEKDPLDEILVEDAGADPSGKSFLEEHRRLEAEVRAQRKENERAEYFLKMRIATSEDVADFDRELRKNPSLGLEEIDPRKRASVKREAKEARERAAQGWRPPTLREFTLGSAREMEKRARPARFAIARFEPELPRNPTASVLETSASEAFSGEETNEVTDILEEVFRSHRYKQRVHPGARQFLPSP